MQKIPGTKAGLCPEFRSVLLVFFILDSQAFNSKNVFNEGMPDTLFPILLAIHIVRLGSLVYLNMETIRNIHCLLGSPPRY